MDQTNHTEGEQEQLAEELREAFGLGPGASGFEVRLGASDDNLSAPIAAGHLFDADDLGRRLGDFEILGMLGRGGMGVVYRARQVSLNREVALKVLPTYAQRGRMAIQRFKNEAQAAARLHHTNIVPVYAQGEDGNRFYYAMEMISGGSLDQAIRSRSAILCPSRLGLAEASSAFYEHGASPETASLGWKPSGGANTSIVNKITRPRPDPRELPRTPRDYRHLATLIAEVADALEHAHRAGVVHRDIKPQNLLIGHDQRLHITDFGLARLADAPGLTMTGEVMGTPAYLSPEQINADQPSIDQRTDIYSLGVTLYELLTLRRPFEGETREQIITGIRTVEPRAPKMIDPHIPRELQTICLKAMEKDASRRYASAADMAVDLRRFADGRPILSRPTRPWVKMAKWVRRHKAASTAIAAAMMCCVLVAGLAASVVSGRRERADRLIDETRERLVYLDYTATDGVTENLNEAERLGGDALEIGFLRAVADFFGPEATATRCDAVEQLERLMQQSPMDAEIRYMLACALDCCGQEARAHDLIDQTDELSVASAAAWLFRGLALHYDNPDEAIRSYKTARQLRALDGQMFLQATLHLARAHNQSIYTTRNIVGNYVSAVEALKQLIEMRVYRAKPYHMLSITHRLAAEFHKGSEGTRSDNHIVEDEYNLALATAREGQSVDPQDPRCFHAEAQCLESMNLINEAIEVRTKAIEVASMDQHHACEGYHYRWRDYFWVGRLDEALADVEAHRVCPQETPLFYDHFYPALIYAERGDLERAISEAYAITDDAPGRVSSIIWTATCLRLLGEADAANRHLDIHLGDKNLTFDVAPYQTSAWVETLARLIHGEPVYDDLVTLAEQTEQPWKLLGEADFHLAALRLVAGDRERALAGFQQAFRSYDTETRYTFHALLLCRTMQADDHWPAWIPFQGT